MPPFPSTDWMHAYAEAVAAHPQADALLARMAGRYRFVVTADDGRGAPEVHDLVVADGAVVVAPPDPGGPAPTLTLTASRRRWRGLVRGEADVLHAILLRRLRVAGDLGLLTRRADAAAPLLECLQAVETTFPD